MAHQSRSSNSHNDITPRGMAAARSTTGSTSDGRLQGRPVNRFEFISDSGRLPAKFTVTATVLLRSRKLRARKSRVALESARTRSAHNTAQGYINN
jgi:hypothetical protein